MQQQRGDDDGLQDIIAAARLKTSKPARSSAKQEQRGPVREFFGKCVVRAIQYYAPPSDEASVTVLCESFPRLTERPLLTMPLCFLRSPVRCQLSSTAHPMYTLTSGIRTSTRTYGPHPTLPVQHIQPRLSPWGLARCWAAVLLCIC